MKTSKPKILLCWGYHRKGWLHAFNKLDEHFEYYYLFHLTKPENEVNHSTTDRLLYWTDYKSAQEVLDKINPDKVVFMGINSPNTIALNAVAKSRHIETLIVQHGMFHRYEDYLRLAREEMKERQKKNQFIQTVGGTDRFFLLKFFLRSVIFTAPLSILYVFRLRRLKNKMLEIEALKKAPSKYCRPDKYLVFTKDNASIYTERDQVSPDDLIEIGNPEMDEYFNYKPLHIPEDNAYYLLIDQPWSEVKDYNSPGFGISKEQTNSFYKELAEYCEYYATKLKIKLHPYSYSSTFLLNHPNIEYIHDVDIVPLIMDSRGVFGFNSTLTLPAIYFKKSCLFRIWEESSYQNDIEALGVAQVLEYHGFTKEKINFEQIDKTQSAISQFVQKYFHQADGNAVERLKQQLS